MSKKVTMSNREVIVSISLNGHDIRIGKLWFQVKNNKESASFEYDKAWLNHTEKFALEPALNLTDDAFHTGQGTNLFGAIGDSAPDRWGRVLMRRAETSQAKKQNRTPKTLFEIDYLLGVNDEARQGALRFSISPNENIFLSSNQKNSIPPLIDLPKLLSATEKFFADNESAEDLKLLLAPGSSLGGARPKASIRDKNSRLAIAKFPKKDDDFNVVVWEAVTLTLAKKAGINIPSYRLEKICEKPVLIINRFDRDNSGNRIPFLSAMSMLGARDNEQHSYLEIADALAQHGAFPEEDMQELWRRIVFTVMVANTDDHLRNHGFLYKQNGWRLSPAYDINPTPIEISQRILTTSIDLYDNAASLETALRIAEEFRVNEKKALSIIKEVSLAVKQWQTVASQFGLSKQECDRMSSAFAYE